MSWKYSSGKIDDNNEKIKLVNEYLNALYEQSEDVGAMAPVWKGLLEINYESTKLKLLSTLLGHAWT